MAEPKQNWAVGHPSPVKLIGLIVYSWHRWRWQAERKRRVLARLGWDDYHVYSRAECDDAWRIADRLAELQDEEMRRRASMERTREFLDNGPSTDVDGLV